MEIGRGGFYHITHISNLASILNCGLYSHDQVRKRKISYSVVYDRSIVERRGYIPTNTRKSLHEYVNLYFNPRNPMMYRVKVHEQRDVAVVQVNSGVLGRKGIWLADGNAAANATAFHPVDKKTLAQLRQQVDRESWNDPDETVKRENGRKMMAECLVPVHISPEKFEALHVVDRRSADKVMQLLSGTDIRLIVNPHMFFSSGEKREYVRSTPRPVPVSHTRPIPRHSTEVAIRHTKTPARAASVSSATTPVAVPENASEVVSSIASAAEPVGTTAPTRRKAQQIREVKVSTPARIQTDLPRAGRKSRRSSLWDLIAFSLMIFFVLGLYEAIQAIRRLLA